MHKWFWCEGLSQPAAVWNITNLQKFHTNCSIYLMDLYTLLCKYDIWGVEYEVMVVR